jgi:hypothetical protein
MIHHGADTCEELLHHRPPAAAAACVAAVVPQVCGFAGPTYLPRRPAQLWPTAVHMSGVSFFWTAPVTWSKDGLVRQK